MAVFAHFIDQLGHQQSRLLALRRQSGAHSGENLAGSLVDILHEWEIEGRVGCAISDNMAANGTCLYHMYQQLNPSMRPVDIKARRMRCYGHTLNLVARAFLQPTRFIESALPLHSRSEYSTAEKRSASETSQKSTLPADHRAYIRASINNGWKKLNEDYDKLGESPLFAAAIILHPRFGISWLEATWVSEEQLAWVHDAKVGIKDYYPLVRREPGTV
ncbi:hypothetical protein ACKAV7_010895 [Fusarium commune]